MIHYLQALGLLEKAKSAFEKRMEDFVVDSKLRRAVAPIDRSHVEISGGGAGGGGATNLVLQNDSNGTIMETFLRNIDELVEKLKKRNKESELKVLDKDVTELFKVGEIRLQ